MTYTVEYTNKVIKQLRKLDKTNKNKIIKAIENVAVDPYAKNPNVKPLKGDLGGYRVRVGDYRVVYDLHDGLRILEVIAAGHRKEIYR